MKKEPYDITMLSVCPPFQILYQASGSYDGRANLWGGNITSAILYRGLTFGKYKFC